MSLKKIITVLLVMALTATAAVGGTLAYLTDRDSEANVFTVGDVKIELNEEFEHASTLIPGVDIKKDVKVTNLGPNDAWVWVTIAIPKELDGGQDASKNVVHFNYSEEAAAEWTWLMTENNEWNIGSYTDENGIEYAVYTTLYNETLSAGEQTATSAMNKVYMDKHVDIDPDGNMAWVDGGNVTPLDWNINEEGNPIIYVSAYAMQAEGFTTAKDAYDAYQAQWGDKGAEYGNPVDADAVIITNLQELKDAAKKGGKYALGADVSINDKSEFFYGSYVTAIYNDMTLDLNGHTITVDVEMESVAKAPVLFYVYSEGASLTIVGDGNVVAKHDAFIVFPRSVSEGAYIYGGNYYNNDATSGTKNDINAIIYSQTNSNIHVYGGTFNFKNVNGHCGGFNVYDNSGAEIVLHEGVLLSNNTYYTGSDANEIHLAEGCTLQEVVIDGATWYQVVKQ